MQNHVRLSDVRTELELLHMQFCQPIVSDPAVPYNQRVRNRKNIMWLRDRSISPLRRLLLCVNIVLFGSWSPFDRSIEEDNEPPINCQDSSQQHEPVVRRWKQDPGLSRIGKDPFPLKHSTKCSEEEIFATSSDRYPSCEVNLFCATFWRKKMKGR